VDRWLLATIALLCGGGLVFLYSSSSVISQEFTGRAHQLCVSQAITALMGVALLVGVSRIDYRRYTRRWAWILWGVTTVLLLYLAVPNPWKATVRETDRWIRLGSFSIQPSEFARLTLALLLASLVSEIPKDPEARRKHILLIGAAIAVPVVLVLAQPNFGTAMVMGVSALALLVLAGLPWRWLFAGIGSLVVGFFLFALRFPYPLTRLERWIDGIRDPEALPFQIRQGLMAMGSGGTWGVGLGESIAKRYFVPDPHTDLILAIVGEEVGFIGVFGLFLLFGILVWRGFRIARRSPDFAGFLLAAGITIQISLYVIVNTGVVTGVLPVTGLPLPFVSDGGSALLANLGAMGILVNISRSSRWYGQVERQRVSVI
jgi:cell division protein FtsW